ncbi:LOW QUALITY PROTEIN: hypothetical protein TorRG33x02_221090 [Trema orientale]|uniref:Uncharacterized protein n=1 Tax=Trema orientale TaxID=63057 RepID=A0A2P5E9C8_TREOI|nr:LOW QUALITY PROTEIN: hypothetical protein TorRG33x02_221090 [Trema orientale]
MSIMRRSGCESLAFMRCHLQFISKWVSRSKNVIEIALSNSHNPFIILTPSTIMILKSRNGIRTLPPRGFCVEIFGILIPRIQLFGPRPLLSIEFLMIEQRFNFFSQLFNLWHNIWKLGLVE